MRPLLVTELGVDKTSKENFILVNKRKQLYFDAIYWNWNRDATKYNLKREEFNEFFKSLDTNKYVKDRRKTRKLPWLEIGSGAWKYENTQTYETIYLFKDHRIYIYSTNKLDDSKNNNQIALPGNHLDGGCEATGTKAVKLVKDKFKENTGTTLLKAFGTVNEEYKICVPKQFYYNEINKKTIIKNISAIDFCSMFPSNMCGKLPDSHTAIEVEGYVKPNEEYEFAFYLDTGHVAIYNEFDSHDWLKYNFCDEVFRYGREKFVQHPYKQDTKTILMKASKYELTSIYEEAYKLRDVDSNMKLITNASIGKFHTKEYKTNKYAHLASVCIARANNKMIHLATIIGRKNIIQICVDGIIYKGNIKYGKDVKALGDLHQEVLNADICYAGMNKYIITENNIVVKYKHGTCNYNTDGSKIEDNTVTCFDDIDRWVKINSESKIRDDLVRKIKGEI